MIAASSCLRGRLNSFLQPLANYAIAGPSIPRPRPVKLPPLIRQKSTLTVVKAKPTAPREVPTPVVFIATKVLALEGHPTAAKDIYKSFIDELSGKGYECLLLDLDPLGLEEGLPERQPHPFIKSKELLERLEKGEMTFGPSTR